jgi:hypothetical protein
MLLALPQCRGRIVRAIAVDPDGLGTLLPRFLTATRLPPALAAKASSVRAQARQLLALPELLSLSVVECVHAMLLYMQQGLQH